jgi:sugar phosphate isomerase/epimerase
MTNDLSRRSFLGIAATLPLAASAALKGAANVPIGLELYSVRGALAKDLLGTVAAVGKMGYQVVEFYAPYMEWTPDKAKEVRKCLDDNGLVCRSTHNGGQSFTPDGMKKAIELNQIIGSKYIIWASAGQVSTLDGWKKVADQLSSASAQLAPHGMATGYHNHQLEWHAIEGKRPMDVLAANTPKDVVLQFDVGTCLEAAQDPIAWVKANPGRIKSVHCKDWSRDRGYDALFGEGVAPWKDLFAALENGGGVEYYLIEQETGEKNGGELQTVQRCLENFKKIHA